MQKIVDGLMIQGITEKGWLWDTKKRKYQLQPGEKMLFKIDDVPGTEKAKIEDALRRKGIPVSNEKILELYSRKAGAP
jgi:hypothetical protein